MAPSASTATPRRSPKPSAHTSTGASALTGSTGAPLVEGMSAMTARRAASRSVPLIPSPRGNGDLTPGARDEGERAVAAAARGDPDAVHGLAIGVIGSVAVERRDGEGGRR